MKNPNSTDGYLEDLIRSITQLICSEGHLKTIIEKVTAELENGIVDVDDPNELNKALDKLESAQTELDEIADTRRKMMVYLYEKGEGDKDYWCQIKHLANASYTAFEAWQGSNNDPLLYDLALTTNKHFIKALTHFMGYELTNCASCISDFLKGEKADGKDLLSVPRNSEE